MRGMAMVALAITAGCGGDAAPVAPRVDLAPLRPAAAKDPENGRVVYDLIGNRPLAQVHVAGNLLIDAGSADFWKYIDGGWKSNWYGVERDLEHRVALVQGIAGLVRFPLDRDGDGAGGDPGGAGKHDLRVAFTLRPAVARQAMTLFLNEKPLANLALVEGYQTHEVTLPADRLVAGDNSLRFHFRAAGSLNGKHTAAAFERILVGPKGARTDVGPTPRLGAAYGLAGDVRRALGASHPARFSYYLTVPPSTRLELWSGTQQSGDLAAVTFLVRAAVDGQPPVELWRGAGSATWSKASIDLAALAGQTVRLDLCIRGGGGAFAEPRLVADGRPTARPRGKAAEHVLVWMVDTLRADRLDAPGKVKVPGFEQLAREATRFTHTTVQGNYSLPSHSSLLTGTLPPVHHMFAEKDRLPTHLPLLSEQFQRSGFATAIFSSNGYVSEKWGFRRGWETYKNFLRDNQPASAADVWKAARAWLTSSVKAGKRTFMYLATADPHVAYNPPPRFLKEYWPHPEKYRGPIRPAQTSEQLYQIKLGKLRPGDEDKRFLEALYNAEVTQNDATFLEVMADLKQLGIYDTTAIVVVSDHGDEFFDHGSVGHGHSLYQELVDVPLLVRWPPLLGEGRAVAADVEVMDVYATLLDVAGLDVNGESQGESLLPLAADAGPRMDRPSLAYHDSALRSLRVGRWKLLSWSGTRLALYDLAADPHEKKDLAASHPIALRHARNLFALSHAYELRWRKARWGVATDLKPAFADEIGM